MSRPRVAWDTIAGSLVFRPGLRGDEAFLLLLATVVGALAATPLMVVRDGSFSLEGLVPSLMLAAAFWLLHLSFSLRLRDADPLVLPILLVLMSVSLAFQQRLAPALQARQFRWLMLGTIALGVAAHLPFEWRWLRRYRYTWAALGIGLVGLTLLFGRSAIPGGPALWLGVGSLSFQPAEALKLLVVVFLAAYLEDKRELLAEARLKIGPLRLMPLPYLAPLGVILGLSLALLGAQGDLGAALLIFTTALTMLYLASARTAYVISGLAGFTAGAWLLYRMLDIVQLRVDIWLDPWADPQGSGYQLIQSLMAIGAGGVFGAGIGLGAPTAIPAVHTDFVYAALVEELGLAGASALLLLYFVLFVRGLRIAILAETFFRQMLAAGLTFALAIQTLIILGGVTKLIPLTGITLPFLSYGGTSMLTSALAVGLLLRISGERA